MSSKIELPQEVLTATWKAVYNDDEKTTISSEDRFQYLDDAAQEVLKKKPRTEKQLIVNEDYTGPRLTQNEEVTELFIQQLVESYESETPVKLHQYYVKKILLQINELFAVHNALERLTVPKGGTLTVVGDTHGQLLDALTIFRKRGFPSSTNIFLFNGDIVDRGPHCVELLLLLYSLKLQNKNSIFFNRGNHEHRRLNSKYSFEDQVMSKYDGEIYDLIQNSFIQLPIATVLNNQVLVVHGGLTHHDVTLDDINSLNFRRQLGRHADNISKEDQLMEHLLWSDPKEIEHWEPSSRGSGIHFGKEITKKFLSKNNLRFVIRSHECEDDGYHQFHDNLVITIFSASFYCGDQRNKGAVIVFNDEEVLSPNFEQYYASALAFENVSHPIKDFERVTITRLHEKIFECRQQLLVGFSKKDPNGTGSLSLADWEAVMVSETGLNIPWIQLLPYIGSVKDDNTIQYVKFLNRFKISTDKDFLKQWKQQLCTNIADEIRKNFSNIQAAFSEADVDKNGTLSFEEFAAIIKRLDIELSEPEVSDLLRSIDRNYSGTIDFEEFAESFDLKTTDKDLVMKNLQLVYKAVMKRRRELDVDRKERLRNAFLEFSSSHSKHISYSELRHGLRDYLGLKFKKDEVNMMGEMIDKNGSKSISIVEFCDAVKEAHSAAKERNWKSSFIQTTLHSLFSSRHQLKRAYRTMDVDNSGSITFEEFSIGMHALNKSLAKPISKKEVKLLFEALDKNGDGNLDYAEFLSAFEVVDSKKRKNTHSHRHNNNQEK